MIVVDLIIILVLLL